MTPIDIGLSESSSRATQFGDWMSGARLSTTGGTESVIKYAILGAVVLFGVIAWMFLRK